MELITLPITTRGDYLAGFHPLNDRSHVRITYEYSPNGDIIQKRRTCTQDGGDLLLLDTIEYGYDENHRLVRFGNDYIVYNGNGYPTNYRGRTLTWSVTNLASFYYHGNYVQYMYFSDGRRSVKRVNGRTINYIYDHNRIVCENSVSTDGVESNMFYIYGIDGTVSCILKDASKHFLLRDQLGNVVAIVSDDGTLECSYQYDPYGNTTVYDPFGNVDLDPMSIGNTNPFRYRGYYYDVETGLYWLSSRYYDPEIGRFISPDSLDYLDPTSINGLNLYAYCNNDPVNFCDPSGHFAISTIIGIIIGVVALAATANDIYQLANKNVYVNENRTNSENVSIENSYKILTPWMRYGYSFYLNHFNPNTKDVIQGSTAGVQFEWELHNYAAWVGIGGDSAKHLDVGKSIFTDGKAHPFKDEYGNITPEGIMSLGMRIGYIIFENPLYWIWDLIANGGF